MGVGQVKDERLSEDFVAELAARVALGACPACGVTGQITIRERLVPIPLRGPVSLGPRGFPLFIQCGACGSGGLVVEIPRSGLSG